MTGLQPVPFGKYLLLDRIGVNATAELYRAKTIDQQGVEKRVLIKKILPHLTADKVLIKSFMDEAKISSLLQHENIIQIYDFGSIDGTYFIAIEYLFGQTLEQVNNASKKQERPIGLENALYITAQICSGLQHAHKLKNSQGSPHNITHGNISPHSIFITYEGQVKITDFGIHTADTQDSRMHMGIMKGKLAYMSPQQVDGKTIDHRSDIFSTGILLYEMVTGKQMFEGQTMQVFSRLRQAKFEPPESIVDCQHPEVYEIIYRALEKQPEKRYPTAGQMLADLHKVISAMSSQPTASGLAQYMKGLLGKKTDTEDPIRKEVPRPDFTEVFKEESSIEDFLEQEVRLTDSEEPSEEGNHAIQDPPQQAPQIDSKQPLAENTDVGKLLNQDPAHIHSARTNTSNSGTDKKGKTHQMPHAVAEQEQPKKLRRKGVWHLGLAGALVIICLCFALLFKKGLAVRQLLGGESPRLEAGIQALEAQRFLEALALFDEVLADEPAMVDRVSEPYSRALQAQAAGLVKTDPEKAEVLLIKALKFDPQSVQALSRLALHYLRQKKYTKAIEAYQKVAELDPESPDTFFNLGYIYATQEDYSRAQEMYGRVVELAPSFLDEALFNLAMIHEKLGKRNQCIKNLQQAIKVNPDNKQAQKYLQSLKS
jgi:serine/threonine protein kinase/Tfp pilus assembly protein PilF